METPNTTVNLFPHKSKSRVTISQMGNDDELMQSSAPDISEIFKNVNNKRDSDTNKDAL